MIETTCKEILGNYTKKEDQLMTAAFGTRPKRRLNRVMDALNFEYTDYERLDEGAGGAKMSHPGFKGQSRVHLIHAPKKTTYIITECIEINVTITSEYLLQSGSLVTK
jgi:hypothetical protein